MPQKKTRDSSFELLRIVCAFLIIFSHWSDYSGFMFDIDDFGLSRLMTEFMRYGGKISCNCFVLISGYFLVSSKFSFSKALRLWFETFFYSVSIYIFGVVFGMTEFSATALIRHCLPLMTEQYWFIRAYFVLYLLVPPLNAMIRAMGSRVHKYAIVALFVPLCVVGTLVYLPFFENMNPWFSDELWFIELYLIAAYVKLYPSAFTESRKLHFALSAAITLFIWASFLIMDPICAWYNPGRPEEEGLYAYFLSSQFTITGFLCAFFYFLAFKNMRLPSLPVVDYVATTVFGVYLIHTHPLLLKRMWQGVFSTVKYFGTFWFVPASVGVCLATFVICGVIDKIRYYLLERPLFRLRDPAVQKLQEKVFPSEEMKENLLQIMH